MLAEAGLWGGGGVEAAKEEFRRVERRLARMERSAARKRRRAERKKKRARK